MGRTGQWADYPDSNSRHSILFRCAGHARRFLPVFLPAAHPGLSSIRARVPGTGKSSLFRVISSSQAYFLCLARYLSGAFSSLPLQPLQQTHTS